MDKQQVVDLIKSHPEMDEDALRTQFLSMGGDVTMFNAALVEAKPSAAISQNTRLYTVLQLDLSAFFWGPILAGFFLGRNFKHLGDATKARLSLLVGIFGEIALFALAYFVNLKDVGIFIPLIISAYVNQYAKKTQGAALEAHFKNGGKKGSWIVIIGTMFLMMLLVMAIVMGPLLLLLIPIR